MADRIRSNLIDTHQEWLGFVQPIGLVLSPSVMADAQVVPDRNISGLQQDFRELLEEDGSGDMAHRRTPELDRVFRDWLGWAQGDLVDAANHSQQLEISLPELQTILSPTWAVPGNGTAGEDWKMLVHVEDDGADLDKPPGDDAGWNATRHARFERLLRETGIGTGLLCTDERIRLVHAPKGESSGYLTFDFSQMSLPAGRPILAAFHMLLSADALFTAPKEAQLPTLLAKSREAQAEVSNQLSRQVLAALHELLRGFVSSDARICNATTKLARQDPEHLYGGLITTLMRLVFVLYAEDRGLMPNHPVYQQHYSLGGLFDRLRADAATWPDTMDQRFGAWTQLLSLFRLVHGGGRHSDLSFVARGGALFDPGRFPFLEGCKQHASQLPMIPDLNIWKVLQSLMMLNGERLSYRTLDVEQIGSVYESIMGFRLELTTGRSVAVTSPKRTGAATVVDIDKLLEFDGGKREKKLRDKTGRQLSGSVAKSLRDSATVEDIVAALDPVIDRDSTPDVVPSGTPVLQPTDERRRSGSHYTPRSLTEPIVSEALRPTFERLGKNARPEEILGIKVLDPATGSGAFLVEACRQLSERLVEAWTIHGGPSELPPHEDELLHAQRLVAQKCLYGVDRNPMAIDLARLSLWLATLSREQEFTFVDHALRHGDSLVGLTCNQIERFHWDKDAPGFQLGSETPEVRKQMQRVLDLRIRIREANEEADEEELQKLLSNANDASKPVRRIGDLILTAFFQGEKTRERKNNLARCADLLLGTNPPPPPELPVTPFHWELEFPEVFERKNPGFDAIVGNPPFAGKNTIAAANADAYPEWLKQLHPESHGNSDLAAHFFRRTFNLLRECGAFGLISTNTIAQGDTRATGLRWICNHGGTIYLVNRRKKWPGEAAVVVSIIHITKDLYFRPRKIDGREVERITAFLFNEGEHNDPERLKDNNKKSFQGSMILGMGFTFDDTDKKGTATPLSEMRRLIERNPRNQDVLLPYIGGEELNTSPTHTYHRHVIDFRNWPLRRDDLGMNWCDSSDEQHKKWLREGIVPLDYPDSVAADWPELLAILEEKVKPERVRQKTKALRERWWSHANQRPNLYSSITGLDRVLAISQIGLHAAFAFLPYGMIYAKTMIVFPFSTYAPFCALQSRPHEVWARFFGSSFEDRLCYAPTDCFETFPFPEGWETHPALEAAGKAYYEFRANLMIIYKEGMTKIYNQFHDPDESDLNIVRLRELHAEMDRAIIDAYGWADISTDCAFLLDHEIDEDEGNRKKKPWRYRWPDDIRNEVLARLLALNADRAAEERRTGSGVHHSPESTKTSS